jgi:hypothetical protein
MLNTFTVAMENIGKVRNKDQKYRKLEMYLHWEYKINK